MRFEVPQFIEIEDKIFGPFTWRQFLYLGGGVGFAVVLFITLPIFFFALIGLPIAGLACLLAFYPINNRPFSIFLESVFRFYNSTRIYRWRRTSNVVYKEKGPAIDMPQTAVNVPKTDNITSLARQLELNALQKPE